MFSSHSVRLDFHTNIDSGTAKPITLIKETVINSESKNNGIVDPY